LETAKAAKRLQALISAPNDVSIMNDFVGHGFLSSGSESWTNDFDRGFQDWIALYHEVNDEGMKMLLVAKQDGSSN